jgi:hypothetical protein
MRLRIPLPIVLFLFFAACTKTDNTSTVSVAFQLEALTSAVQGASIEWTAGTASVISVAVETKKEDNSEITFKAVADTFINLFAPVTFATVAIPTGNYKQLAFKTIFDRLRMHPALRLEGSYIAAGVSIPVIFEVNTLVELKAKKDTVSINNAGTYRGSTTIDLSLLTKGIPESDLKAADKPSGTIILSSSSNPGIYSKMLLNLGSCIGVDLH